MKKFLIIIILFIPIVVLLSINFTGVVISATTSVQAEYMEIRDSNNKELDYNLVYDLELTTDHMTIIVIITPSITYDDTATFKCSKDSEGEVTVSRVEKTNRYQIHPKKSGAVTLIASASSNINVNRNILMYISTRSLGTLSICNGGKTLSQDEPNYITERTKLSISAYPIESIANKTYVWSSSDEDIAVVDLNGNVTPKKAGEATITCKIVDNNDDFHSASVKIDTTNCMSSLSHYYLLAPINIETVRDLLIVNSITTIEQVSKDSFKLTLNQQSKIITLEQVDANEIELVCAPFQDVYTCNGGYYAEVKYLAYDKTSTCQADSIISSDTSILSIAKNGELILHKQGQVTLTATFNGISVFKDISVKTRVSTFSLNLTEQDNIRGIEGEKYYAYNWYKDSSRTVLTHSLQLKLNPNSVIPRGSSPNLRFGSSNDNFATVNKDGLVTLLPDSLGKKIVITASELVDNVPTNVLRTYTINVLPEENAVNVNSIEDASFAMERELKPIALQDDIRLIDNGNDLQDTIFISKSIYGNGYKIENSKTCKVVVSVCSTTTSGALTISNVIIYGGAPTDATFKANGLNINSHITKDDQTAIQKNTLEIRFCLIAYCGIGINVINPAELSITKSIFSNIATASIFSTVDRPTHYKLNLSNLVIRDTTGVGILFNSYETGSPSLPNVQNLPQITIDGFIDSYTWTTIENLGKVFAIVDFDELNSFIEGLGTALEKELSKVIVELLSRPQYSHLNTVYKGTKYYHLAGVMLGLWCSPDPTKLTDNTDKFKAIELTLTKDSKVSIMGLNVTVDMIQNLSKLYLCNPNYILSYDFNLLDADILPDTKCPNTEELYARLRG